MNRDYRYAKILASLVAWESVRVEAAGKECGGGRFAEGKNSLH